MQMEKQALKCYIIVTPFISYLLFLQSWVYFKLIEVIFC